MTDIVDPRYDKRHRSVQPEAAEPQGFWAWLFGWTSEDGEPRPPQRTSWICQTGAEMDRCAREVASARRAVDDRQRDDDERDSARGADRGDAARS